MKPFTIEETIDLSEKGWNVGTTLYGSPFMQWLHGFPPPSKEYLDEKHNQWTKNVEKYWKGKNGK